MHEDMYEEIELEGVEIHDVPFEGNIKGLYGDNVIFIRDDLSQSEKNCTVAEELEHHYTTCGNILNLNDFGCIKQECVARRRAYRRLVKIEDIIKAYNAGIRDGYELADFLHVTEKFLQESLEYYKCVYGVTCVIGGFTISFDPLNVIKIKNRLNY